MTKLRIDKYRSPMIAVAPNGARYTKQDHPALPVTARELAETASRCLDAGASMIHVHVRDGNGRHSLEPAHYRAAVEAIREATGDRLLIQVTSEAAGVYGLADQVRLIDALSPAGLSVSVAIREFFPDERTGEPAAESGRFLERLERLGTMLQYILYSPGDVRRYRRLLADGVIPGGEHLVLFVLGKYPHSDAQPHPLEAFLAEHDTATPWMACAFGADAIDILSRAAARGGHVRIGFENGWLLPDGSIAPDNAALVRALADRIRPAS